MNTILKQYTTSQIEKAKRIRAIICDVDGVLTDGGIIYDNHGNELKKFNVKDGQIIGHLKRAGILVGAITGRASEVVRFRCKELNFDFHYHGASDKLLKYQEIKMEYSLNDGEIAYLGDDVIDIPILRTCGLAIAPEDALTYVKQFAHVTTQTRGGAGVLREAADFVLASQGKMEEIVEYYSLKK